MKEITCCVEGGKCPIKSCQFPEAVWGQRRNTERQPEGLGAAYIPYQEFRSFIDHYVCRCDEERARRNQAEKSKEARLQEQKKQKEEEDIKKEEYRKEIERIHQLTDRKALIAIAAKDPDKERREAALLRLDELPK